MANDEREPERPRLTYRNRALLDVCHTAPCLLLLGAPGCGSFPSVPCHSDLLRHGRGVGHKSDDVFAVPGCPPCHAIFTRAKLGKEGYEDAWLQAHERYLMWLFRSGHLTINKRAAIRGGACPN